MQLRLEKAELSDSRELLKIQCKAFGSLLEKYQDHGTNPATETLEKMEDRLKTPGRDLYFICLDDLRIGMIITAHSQEKSRLIRIAIMPEYQKYGYSQMAIKLAESLYPKTKVWMLDTVMQEEKLCYLYEKMGYLKTGEMKNLKDGMDLIYYMKKIRSTHSTPHCQK